MAHSNRKTIHWVFVIIEIILFCAAVASAYFSEINNWSWFAYISIIAIILYTILKIVEAQPVIKELFIKEDMASKVANSLMNYGVSDCFCMQSSEGQTARNKSTQNEIKNAQSLYLCANSGTSYLDPAIYRHWPYIEKKIIDGVSFRIVLLDPFSAEKGFRNQLNVGGESFDSKLNIANLIKLYNKYETLEIRFVRYGMHSTVFATDKCLFFDPYHVGVIGDRIENRSFTFFLNQTSSPHEGVGFYRLFKAHFDTLWRAGTSIDEWIERTLDKLPKDLPEINKRQYTS